MTYNGYPMIQQYNSGLKTAMGLYPTCTYLRVTTDLIAHLLMTNYHIILLCASLKECTEPTLSFTALEV